MGDQHWMKIEFFHMLGGSESKRLKVTALSLFHPTASSLSGKGAIFILRHSLLGGRGRVRGGVRLPLPKRLRAGREFGVKSGIELRSDTLVKSM